MNANKNQALSSQMRALLLVKLTPDQLEVIRDAIKPPNRLSIMDWDLCNTMSLEDFISIREEWNTQGTCLQSHSKMFDYTCENCKSPHVMNMGYGANPEDEKYCISMCLNCFQVGLWMPVYTIE